MKIETIADIQNAVRTGFTAWKQYGEIYTRAKGNLLLFNYLPTAQYAGVWTPLERMSRGLIINSQTGEVVARPFDKFYNWLEGGRKASGHIVSVTEKMDGSLGVLYRDNGYKIATRGSFDSEQAEWTTRFLNEAYDLTNLPDAYTLLFEIIYPDNRIVVDYGTRQDLVLLAVRNRFTGDYLPFFPDVYELASAYGFSLPKVYTFNDIGAILEQTGVIDANHEGWVVEFSDGSRWKIKGDRYRELHKLISGISYRTTLAAMESGTLQSWIDTIPDEFLTDVRTWMSEITTAIDSRKAQVESAFHAAPKDDRKTFALWVQKHHKDIMSHMFTRLDNKPLEPALYKELRYIQKTNARVARVLEAG